MQNTSSSAPAAKRERPCAQAGNEVQRRDAGGVLRRPNGALEILRFQASSGAISTHFNGRNDGHIEASRSYRDWLTMCSFSKGVSVLASFFSSFAVSFLC